MTTETSERRKYALVHVAAGDYLCASNDGHHLWRFMRYTEDGSLETGDGKQIVGDFWEAYRMPMPAEPESLDPDDIASRGWSTEASLLATRAAAIDVMLRRKS